MISLPRISQLLQQNFQRNGFAVVPDALNQELTRRWRQWAERLKTNALTIKRAHGDFQLVYRVVPGEVIREQWPELFAFYEDPATLQWIRDMTRETAVCTSSSLRSAINLNIMESTDSVYRWHFDAVPYTLLLYLNDVVPEDGGAMQLVPQCKPQVQPDLSQARIVDLWPKAGTCILMDGTRCYHRVSRLLRPTTRLSIPLVYPNSKAAQRPMGLDDYLYKESA
jgi:hypothetical protein